MKKEIQMASVYLVVICVVGLLMYGGWRLRRWWNWEWDYASQVEIELEPIRQEIKELGERVNKLEKKEVRRKNPVLSEKE